MNRITDHLNRINHGEGINELALMLSLERGISFSPRIGRVAGNAPIFLGQTFRQDVTVTYPKLPDPNLNVVWSN